MKPLLSLRLPLRPLHHASSRLHHPLHFPTSHFSTSPPVLARNRIYQPIRSLPTLTETILLSSSSSRPFLALFTAGTTSRTHARIAALVQRMLEEEGVGEEQGGVGFAEVEVDAPDAGEVAGMFMISSLPTLLAFSRGEPQQLTKVTDTAELQDREFLKMWIENEAQRGGAGGAGGGMGWNIGGLFGLGR